MGGGRARCSQHCSIGDWKRFFSEDHLRRAVSSYVTYFSCSRPQLDQRAPRDSTTFQIELWRPTARFSQSRYSAICITSRGVWHDGLYFYIRQVTEMHDELTRLNCPALVIGGQPRSDPPAHLAKAVADVIPHAVYVEVAAATIWRCSSPTSSSIASTPS